MPKNPKEELVFSIMMVICMVYVMVFYNVSLEVGLSYNTFMIALKALPITALIAWLVEELFVGKLARKIAFNNVDPKKSESIIIIVLISSITVIFMCPIMSFIETVIYHYDALSSIPLIFIKTFALNVPVALFAQLLYVGPFVRIIFEKTKKYIR